MTITFTLVAEDGAEFPEAAAGSFALAGRLPCAPGDCDGNLRFSHPGQEEAAIADDLPVLFPNLLEAYRVAEQSGSAELAIGNAYRQYALKVSGVTVALEDATVPPEDFRGGQYPRAEFREALTECARRFERFLTTLVERDAQWGEDLEALRAALARLA